MPNTFGVPGVEENAMFFKEIAHASKFRREVSERFERATLPDVPDARLAEVRVSFPKSRTTVLPIVRP